MSLKFILSGPAVPQPLRRSPKMAEKYFLKPDGPTLSGLLGTYGEGLLFPSEYREAVREVLDARLDGLVDALRKESKGRRELVIFY